MNAHQIESAAAAALDYSLEETRYSRGGLIDLIARVRMVGTLADAGSCFVQTYQGCELDHDQVKGLFDAVVERCEHACDDLEQYLSELTAVAAAAKRGLQ